MLLVKFVEVNSMLVLGFRSMFFVIFFLCSCSLQLKVLVVSLVFNRNFSHPKEMMGIDFQIGIFFLISKKTLLKKPKYT